MEDLSCLLRTQSSINDVIDKYYYYDRCLNNFIQYQKHDPLWCCLLLCCNYYSSLNLVCTISLANHVNLLFVNSVPIPLNNP